jgi:hypothetical protein
VDIHVVYRTLGKRFRLARMTALVREFGLDADTKVLDVGGTPRNWDLVDVRPQVTLLNLSPDGPRYLPENLTYVQGDGRTLPFDDGSFDVVVSNSVLEHVGEPPDQRRFAAELRRVGRGVWVQAPAFEFVIEPHYLAPFVHWFPERVQRRVLRWLSPWGWITRPDQAYIDFRVAEIRLPSRRRMQVYFPDCELRTERVLGLTKAYVAVRHP